MSISSGHPNPPRHCPRDVSKTVMGEGIVGLHGREGRVGGMKSFLCLYVFVCFFVLRRFAGDVKRCGDIYDEENRMEFRPQGPSFQQIFDRRIILLSAS